MRGVMDCRSVRARVRVWDLVCVSDAGMQPPIPLSKLAYD